jgi:hypothetical protein
MIWALKSCLKFPQCHINLQGVIDTAEITSAVSLTPLSLLRGVTDTKKISMLSVVVVSAVSKTPSR